MLKVAKNNTVAALYGTMPLRPSYFETGKSSPLLAIFQPNVMQLQASTVTSSNRQQYSRNLFAYTRTSAALA